MKHTRKTLLILATAIATIFGSCSKDDGTNTSISLKTVEKSLFCGDKYQIEAASTSEIIYTSENEYNATVTSSGAVTARFIGETSITLTNGNDSKKIKIVVNPHYTLYPDPCITFGISKSEIIAKYGIPSTQTATGIGYANYSNASPIVMYLFDANNKLISTGVIVKTTYSSELGAFLAERYLPVDITNLIFINSLDPKKATMLIGASLYDTTYWLVTYGPYTSKSNTSTLKSRTNKTLLFEFIKSNILSNFKL